MVDDLEVWHRIQVAVALMQLNPTVIQTIHIDLYPVNMVVNGFCRRSVQKFQFTFIDRLDA